MDLAGRQPASELQRSLSSAFAFTYSQSRGHLAYSMTSRPLAAMQQNSAANRSSTSLITRELTQLSDPPLKQVDAHLLEFLTAEVMSSSR